MLATEYQSEPSGQSQEARYFFVRLAKPLGEVVVKDQSSTNPGSRSMIVILVSVLFVNGEDLDRGSYRLGTFHRSNPPCLSKTLVFSPVFRMQADDIDLAASHTVIPI